MYAPSRYLARSIGSGARSNWVMLSTSLPPGLKSASGSANCRLSSPVSSSAVRNALWSSRAAKTQTVYVFGSGVCCSVTEIGSFHDPPGNGFRHRLPWQRSKHALWQNRRLERGASVHPVLDQQEHPEQLTAAQWTYGYRQPHLLRHARNPCLANWARSILRCVSTVSAGFSRAAG